MATTDAKTGGRVARSMEMYERLLELIPGGTQLISRRPTRYALGVSPVVATRGKGSRIWGELLSTAATNAGCVGAIVDGAVRDIRQMAEMGFPVFARSRNIYDSKDRQRVVDVDVTVEIDGVRFAPGDLVIADVDGVVVVPSEIQDQAIQAAWQKVHAENITRDAIRDGMKATDAYEKYGVL